MQEASDCEFWPSARAADLPHVFAAPLRCQPVHIASLLPGAVFKMSLGAMNAAGNNTDDRRVEPTAAETR
jgi:hypothetical protein